MGFLKMFLNANNAEGIREAMKMTYKKASNHTFLYDVSEECHVNGMMLAMKTRYMTYGKDLPFEAIAIEISPFLLISSQETALDALSEYIVYKEKPIDAKLESLKEVLKNAIKSSKREDVLRLVQTGIKANCPWSGLLDTKFKNSFLKKSF